MCIDFFLCLFFISQKDAVIQIIGRLIGYMISRGEILFEEFSIWVADILEVHTPCLLDIYGDQLYTFLSLMGKFLSSVHQEYVCINCENLHQFFFFFHTCTFIIFSRLHY